MHAIDDLRHAVRSLRRTPGFTLVAVLTLALGMGATTAIFTVVNGVLLRPLPYRHSERIATIWHDFGDGAQSLPAIHQLDLYDYADRSQVFEEFTIATGREAIVRIGEEPVLLRQGRVGWNFFRFFGIEPAAGRQIRSEEDVAGGPAVALVSHQLWETRLGADPAALGRTLLIDGREHDLIGVLPEDFRLRLPAEAFRLTHSDVWVPVQVDRRRVPPRNYTGYTGFARLAEGRTFAEGQEEMEALAAGLRREHPEHEASNLKVRIVPLHQDIVKPVRGALALLLGAVFLVLLIACANLANLFMVRGNSRARELAVRSALGAGRRRLAMVALSEGILVALAGTVLGLVLASGGLRLLLAIRPAGLPLLESVRIDAAVLAFSALACVLSVLVFSAVPVLQGVRTDSSESLRERSGSATRSQRSFRNALVVGELALSVVLLIATGLLIRSFGALVEVDPGYQTRGLLTARVSLPAGQYRSPESRLAFLDSLQASLARFGEVESVAVVSQLPLAGSGPLQPFAYDEDSAREWESVTADQRQVTPGFFRTIGATLLAGREFDTSDIDGRRRVIIIDDRLAELAFAGRDAVGARLQIEPSHVENRFAEVVGVVRHLRLHDLTRPIHHQIYFPFLQSPGRNFSLVLRTSVDPEALAPRVRTELQSLEPDMALANLSPLERLVTAARGRARLTLLLMSGFGVVATLLALIGVYGVLAYSVSQRRHEMGVRMALGASPGRLRRLVLCQGALLLGAGLGCGLLVALGFGNWIAGLLFEVEPSDPATFLTVAVLSAVTTLVACWLPAWRASRVDPNAVLRME